MWIKLKLKRIQIEITIQFHNENTYISEDE